MEGIIINSAARVVAEYNIANLLDFILDFMVISF
ncbi:hypothetical protein SBA2_640012 [Acidobacteriia bacterium SbA2]|nr:hypothetical protein SBA2_640012 [Acidobacteriia bacterium SbA2]